MDGYRFSVVIGRDEEGWAASCPEYPDCRASGPSYEETLAAIREAIQIRVEALGDDGRPDALEIGLTLNLAL
jgi:predicted RNase H-like HicB family nuclease